ncbi:DUF6886 family protein [Paractinoplanes rishiriensis]|uniref:Uncharacterized protein n=1 Tax=Paractinoplanes rishiriensis TaxID=1050105 RepID=A0A919K193_9ACTN|nr:DUF6886 family protein [Actinoplanes rishiriensis]GIE99046.1 hypothetical protein Ari01nite_65110 [Actinoplanes rishiriensis]
MRPAAGEYLHFSEDPTIDLFVPHVAATSAEKDPYVWAVDFDHAPSYWFPRQCPRGMAWVVPRTTPADRDRIIGAGSGERVHAIEYGWLEKMQTIKLYAYRMPAEVFRGIGDPNAPHAQVSTEPVRPLGPPEPVGNLLDCHAEAGIQLRLLDNLWSFWDEVITSSVGFSGIRLRNAKPRRNAQ